MKKVVIIGAGISGLTCGWHLANAGYQVTILEKELVLGGLARSFQLQDRWLSLTYRHVLPPDTVTQAYIRKLGLIDQLRWVSSSQNFWYDNASYLLSRPQHIFRFKPLGFKDKVGLLHLGLYVYWRKDWDGLAGVDCSTWLQRVVGKKTTELLFQNLMDIKFDMPLSSVSAAWLGSRMHQSVRGGNRYGYVAAGWQELINRIAGGIIERGGAIVNNFEVTAISPDNAVEGRGAGGERSLVSGDMIVSTVPPPVLNEMIDKNASIQDITYKSMVSFVCGSDTAVSPYYWSVVLKPHLIFGGFFNHAVLSPPERDGGEYVYYFFTYLEHTDPRFGYDDERLKELYLEDIKKLFPAFHTNWHRVFKIRFAQPVFARDYKNPAIELRKDFYLSGVYRQFPRPRTMDSAFSSGLETAQHILNRYGRN